MYLLKDKDCDYQIIVSEETKTVVAKLRVVSSDPLTARFFSGLPVCEGVAHCKDSDKFDVEVGKVIAKAKAKRQLYRYQRYLFKIALRDAELNVELAKRIIAKYDKKIDGITHRIKSANNK